jgi:putative SOS response-associated peptidase YedK
MCGRFTATFEFSDIRVSWKLDRDLPNYTPRFNVAPETSPNIPVIIRHGNVNLQKFGLDRVPRVKRLEDLIHDDETSENSTHDFPETMNQPEVKS